MTNPTERAFATSRLAHKNISGSSITISRGLKSSGVVVATVGEAISITYDDDGGTTYTKSREYFIDTLDYRFIGDATESVPERMDVLTEIVNGEVLTFQVTSATAEEAYVYRGVQRTVLKVNTKEM